MRGVISFILQLTVIEQLSLCLNFDIDNYDRWKENFCEMFYHLCILFLTFNRLQLHCYVFLACIDVSCMSFDSA